MSVHTSQAFIMRACFYKQCQNYELPWGKKCSFFGKLDVFRFLETPVLRLALLPYYQCIMPIARRMCLLNIKEE